MSITKKFCFVLEDNNGKSHYWHNTYVFNNWSDAHMYVILKDIKSEAKKNNLFFCTYYEE